MKNFIGVGQPRHPDRCGGHHLWTTGPDRLALRYRRERRRDRRPIGACHERHLRFDQDRLASLDVGQLIYWDVATSRVTNVVATNSWWAWRCWRSAPVRAKSSAGCG